MKDRLNKHIILFTFKHFIVYCLIASVLIKPVSIMIVQLTDEKIELYNIDFEENASNEKELNTDFESEERLFFIASSNFKTQIKESLQDYFNLQENLLDFNPNIQLPPPKA